MRYAAGPEKPLRFSRGLPYNVNQVIKMRLLIVEDELDLAEALAAFLEKHQYIVDTVHDGRSGYDYASSGNYDAVILDIMLPQMDGIEVLKLLRAKGIATLSAQTFRSGRVACTGAGHAAQRWGIHAQCHCIRRSGVGLRRGHPALREPLRTA